MDQDNFWANGQIFIIPVDEQLIKLFKFKMKSHDLFVDYLRLFYDYL